MAGSGAAEESACPRQRGEPAKSGGAESQQDLRVGTKTLPTISAPTVRSSLEFCPLQTGFVAGGVWAPLQLAEAGAVPTTAPARTQKERFRAPWGESTGPSLQQGIGTTKLSVVSEFQY